MRDDRRELAALSTERVVPVPEFAVTAQVWSGVRRWLTVLRTKLDQVDTVHRGCGLCGQSINVDSVKGVKYEYSSTELDGLVLAHLIQRHGWTRETIPVDQVVCFVGRCDE